jgi:type II secretory pathway component GspD/PulD (secretin)
MNADFENGDLRVHGSQDRIKTLVAFARALDSDLKLNTAQPKKVGPPAKNADSTLQIYSVADDSAEAVAKLLQEVYAATQTRITASSRDRIVVWADAETHREIAKQKVLTPPAPPVTKVITLGTLDAVRMAETLKASQQENVRKGLSIIAETQRNALILRGTEEQIREVTQLLASLNDGAGDQRNVRIINLEKGSAVTVAEAVQQLFGTLRDNPLRVIVPGNPPQAMKKDPKSAKPKPPVTLSAFGSRLTVLTDDPEAMAVVVDLVRMLQETTSGEFEVIQLRFAKAAHVAQILDEAYNHPPIRQVSGFGGGGRDGPRATPVERIRVVADPKTNTLLLRASPLDALAIRNLLSRALDTPEAAPTEAKKEDK